MARALSFAEDRLRGSGTRPGPEANPKQSRGAQEKTRKKKVKPRQKKSPPASVKQKTRIRRKRTELRVQRSERDRVSGCASRSRLLL